MSSVTGAHEIIFALREHGDDVAREVRAELADVAQFAARTMKNLAAQRSGKPAGGFGTLVNSIKADKIDADTWDIAPHTDYAIHVEQGVKPGGKGLPRYLASGGKSHNIVQWLRTVAYTGLRLPRKGSKKRKLYEDDIRNRYFGLAKHIRQFGVKANPFVEPTATALEPVVIDRLTQAVSRAMASRGAAA